MQLLGLAWYFTSRRRGLLLSPAHLPGATVLTSPGATMAAAPVSLPSPVIQPKLWIRV